MDIQNGMVIDELWEERKTKTDEEYYEYLDHLDTVREEREEY